MDIARLGLAVDSSQVEKGTVELRQLTGAAGQASAAARQLAGASQVEATGQKAATAATHAHNAALTAQNAIIRSSMQQRTMMIYQLNDIGVSLASGMNPALVAVQQGSQILQNGFAPALRTITDLVGGLVTKFWPVAAVIGVVSAGIAGLTYEINKTADTQVGFFDVALAGWQLLAEDIAESFAPVFGQLGTWMQQGWDAAAPVLKGIGNAIIATSMSIGMVWKSWPSIMGDAVITAVNVALTGITRLLNESRTQLAQFLSTISTLPIPGVSQLASASLGALRDPIQAPQFSNPYQGAMGTAAGAVSDAFGTDYLGGAFDALSARAQEIARARQETEALGGAAAAANDNVKKLADDGLKSAADRAKELADSLGKSIGGALKDLISGTKDFGTVMKDMLLSIAGFLGQQAAGIFGGMGGGFGFFGSILSGLFGGGFANGGVFNAGQQVQAFAQGGVVNRPTLFPMANGAGLMGEAGPEAIMPLRRGSDGKLGVASSGSSGGNIIYLTMANTFSTTGSITERDLQEQNRRAAVEMGQQVIEAVKKGLPDWQANIQVHGAA